MSALVIGQNGRPLMPTTTRKARILLKENKECAGFGEPGCKECILRNIECTLLEGMENE